MTEKAKELINRFKPFCKDLTPLLVTTLDGRAVYENDEFLNHSYAKQCALIVVENEYHSLREMLFNLRSCRVIESEKVYLSRVQELINNERELKEEIENS